MKTEPQSVALLERQAPAHLEPNKRILIVDDNEAIHADFRKILSGDAADADFDAEEAAVFGPSEPSVRRVCFDLDYALQGQHAVELVRAAAATGERYAVAFVDMRMPPGWDGLSTTQKLWEVDPDLQIVICTAYSDYSWEQMIGAIASPERLLILKKPFDTIEVLQFAHALTEKWSLLQAARTNTAALEQLVDNRTSDLRKVNARLAGEISDRKYAEERALRSLHEQRGLTEQLAEERSRLVAAQTVAKVGDWDLDFVTNTRSWSAETYRIFECEELEPDRVRDWYFQIVHPEDAAAVHAMADASLTDPSPFVQQHRLLMPDGRIKFIEQRWQVWQGADGKPLRATGTIQDITDRAEAQQILRRSEMNLALAQSVSQTGSWEVTFDDAHDEDDRVVHWSDQEFRIFGFEPGAVQPTQGMAFDLVHADDRERVAAAFRVASESDVPFDLEHRITWPDGSEREVHEVAIVLRDETGAARKVIGTTRDVTVRNQNERTLREQAEMLNLAQDAIVVRGRADRVITFWNKGAEHLYGWTAGEAIGRRIDELLYRDPEQYEAIALAVETSGEFRGEVTQVAKDGRKVIASARANIVRAADGTDGSVLVIHSDITEHKKLEGQFLRAQRLESIGTLASGVAHDLNNVLAPILMSAPLLREDLAVPLRNRIIDTIEQSADRGAQIVRQVLTFARGVEGDRVLLDPRHLIKEMAEIAQQTFPKNIQVITRYADDLALVEGDPTQLHQVLLNLAVNARDAMPAGGKLVLAAENFDVDAHYAAMTPGTPPGHYVLINVSDTGSGIAAHVMEKMFDPFFTTKDVGRGTGLGLSTVVGIVKSHNGDVNAYSTPTGTTFRILLPASDGQHADLAQVAPEIPRGRGERILVVDDEPAIRELAQMLLERNGYEVLLADDGPAALAIFAQREGEIALVVTDFLMPTMNGLALARIIRKMNPTAKVVISTGREDDCHAVELETIGIAAALTKPYTQGTLLRVIDGVLHGDCPR